MKPLLPKYGRLTVIGKSFAEQRISANGKVYIKRCIRVQCDCGNTKVCGMSDVKVGRIISCGCLNNELRRERKTHGLVRHPLYKVYKGIKSRCYIKSANSFQYYGGRGIEVCEEWRNDFMTFYKWAMESGWEQNLQLDRKDNNGNYEPSNCRFVTHTENMQNSSATKLTALRVKHIRLLKKLGRHTTKRIAFLYGVTPKHISLITCGKSWL